jgi:membrane-associated phospholipid phosphatase
MMAWGTRLGEYVFTLPLLIILFAFPALRNRWYIISALMTNALPSIIVQAVKSSVNAPRPLNYFKGAEWIHTLPEWDQHIHRSFPSGHTCSAFCLFCFISFFLPHGYRPWALLFFLVALFVGVTRVYLAAHFFLDIYVGSIIGTTFTAGIMYLLEYKGGYFFRYVRKR